jgi:predicted ester cyclase
MNDPESARSLAIRWFNEVWNERRRETIYELLGPGSLGHQEGNVDIVGPELFAKFHRTFLETLPVMKVEILDTIAERGKACVHWRVKGTHTGEGLGLKATGKEVSLRGMTWLRIEGDKIVEGWDSWNQQGLIDSLSKATGEE